MVNGIGTTTESNRIVWWLLGIFFLINMSTVGALYTATNHRIQAVEALVAAGVTAGNTQGDRLTRLEVQRDHATERLVDLAQSLTSLTSKVDRILETLRPSR